MRCPLVTSFGDGAGRGRIVAAVSRSVARLRQSGLRAAEHVLFTFLEAIPVGVFIARPGGRPYYANREAVRLLGRGVR